MNLTNLYEKIKKNEEVVEINKKKKIFKELLFEDNPENLMFIIKFNEKAKNNNSKVRKIKKIFFKHFQNNQKQNNIYCNKVGKVLFKEYLENTETFISQFYCPEEEKILTEVKLQEVYLNDNKGLLVQKISTKDNYYMKVKLLKFESQKYYVISLSTNPEDNNKIEKNYTITNIENNNEKNITFTNFEGNKIEELQREFEIKDKKTKSSIASIVHDLRSPIMGMQYLLEKIKSEENPEIRNKNLELALSNAELVMSLVNDILDTTQMDEKKLRLQISKCNVVSVVENVRKLMSLQAEMKNVHIESEYNLSEDFLMYTDERRLKQILINLVSNSIKFTQNGNIAIRVYYEDNLLKFEVGDTGVGMTQSVMHKIGQPFATFNKNNMNSQGIGLGLSICKRLIGLLGPKNYFEVTSHIGEGSIFSFEIYQTLEKGDTENIKNFENRRKNFLKKASNDKLTINDDLVINSRKIDKKVRDEKEIIFDERNSDELSDSKFMAYDLSNNSFDSNDKPTPTNLVKLSKKAISIENLSPKRKSYLLRRKKTLVSMDSSMNKSFGPKLRSKSTFENFINPTKMKQKMNILIIDDTFFNLIILEDFLKRINSIEINVIKESDGLKAIEIFKEKNKIPSNENIEIIFCDLEMPYTSGYEVCQRIKDYCINKNFVEPFIVAYSCDTSNEIIEKCWENKFDEIMNKPATFNELSQLVCEIHEIEIEI